MESWYVHSTCGAPMVFKLTEIPRPNTPDPTVRVLKEIRIGGGAGVIMLHGADIPKVVTTKITEEEKEILEHNDAFVRMANRGFLRIDQNPDPDRDRNDTPSDMEARDNTSQIRDEDHANGTDERTDYIGQYGTRATAGDQNIIGGKQPVNTQEDNYGPIRF